MVSAVITTCKREPAIAERALLSVLNQTYKDIEIIIVDDSPDDYPLRKEVESMVTRHAGVKYIKHAQCMGACAARNTGLRAASGEFIAYLDDDDEWLPEKTAVQLEAFTDDRIALVYCDAYEVDDTTGNKKVCKRKMRKS